MKIERTDIRVQFLSHDAVFHWRRLLKALKVTSIDKKGQRNPQKTTLKPRTQSNLFPKTLWNGTHDV